MLQIPLSCFNLGPHVFHDVETIDNRHHSDLRAVLARPRAQGTHTNLGVRADARALPLDDLVITRRLGLFKRALDHVPPWFIGLIQATDKAPMDQAHQS